MRLWSPEHGQNLPVSLSLSLSASIDRCAYHAFLLGLQKLNYVSVSHHPMQKHPFSIPFQQRFSQVLEDAELALGAAVPPKLLSCRRTPTLLMLEEECCALDASCSESGTRRDVINQDHFFLFFNCLRCLHQERCRSGPAIRECN